MQPCHETLLSPVNGNVHCPTGNRTNDTCYYSCDTGYKLMDGSLQRTCQSNGRWSGRSPSCFPLSCPTLMPPDNGYIQLPCAGVYQSQCSVRCFDGFQLADTDDVTSQVTCSLSSSNDTVWSATHECTSKILHVM